MCREKAEWGDTWTIHTWVPVRPEHWLFPPKELLLGEFQEPCDHILKTYFTPGDMTWSWPLASQPGDWHLCLALSSVFLPANLHGGPTGPAPCYGRQSPANLCLEAHSLGGGWGRGAGARLPKEPKNFTRRRWRGQRKAWQGARVTPASTQEVLWACPLLLGIQGGWLDGGVWGRVSGRSLHSCPWGPEAQASWISTGGCSQRRSPIPTAVTSREGKGWETGRLPSDAAPGSMGWRWREGGVAGR